MQEHKLIKRVGCILNLNCEIFVHVDVNNQKHFLLLLYD